MARKKRISKPVPEEPLESLPLTQLINPVLQHARDLVRLQSEARVRQNKFIEKLSQRQFRLFLDSIPSLIVHVGMDQHVKFCNKSCAEFFGLASRQVFGIPLWKLFSPSDYDAMRPSLLRAFNDREATFEREIQGKQHRYFHATVTPDFTSGSKGVFIFLLDITDRKTLEEKQRRNERRFRALARERAILLHRAREASKLKDNFLATLSHELRTPLTSIVGWTALINSHTLPPDQVAAGMAAIERNAQIQKRLIEELLDLSRISSGKLNLELSDVNIAGLVQQVVESAEPSIHEKHQRLHLKISEDIPFIRGDRERLQQVVSNLLSNAIKFTPSEGHIKVEVYRTSSDLHVAVEDKGDGISKEFLPYIFDEFRQADMSSVRKKGGLGLGLSIARRLVELHGGSIKATSAGVGRGAKFVVTLPISVSQEKSKAAHASRSR